MFTAQVSRSKNGQDKEICTSTPLLSVSMLQSLFWDPLHTLCMWTRWTSFNTCVFTSVYTTNTLTFSSIKCMQCSLIREKVQMAKEMPVFIATSVGKHRTHSSFYDTEYPFAGIIHINMKSLCTNLIIPLPKAKDNKLLLPHYTKIWLHKNNWMQPLKKHGFLICQAH